MSVRLTQDQINALAPLLSKGMTVGGWTMIAFAALAAFLPLLGLMGLISLAEGGEEGLIGFFTLVVVVMTAIGFWMIGYGRKRVLAVLEAELTEAEAEVDVVSGYRYPMGFYVRFEIAMPLGNKEFGTQRYMGKPPWKEGDCTTVYVSTDGKRFFLADQTVPADLGKIRAG